MFGRMPQNGILVVELPSLRTPFVSFTASHPECTTEMVLMPRETGPEPGMTATFLVTGVPDGAAAELRRIVETAYPGLHMWQGGAAGTWLGRFSFAGKQLRNATAQAVVTFLEKRGLSESWVRTKGGTTSLRIHIPAAEDATALARDMRDHLAAANATGLVHLVNSRSDGEGWRELVAHSARRP